VGALAQSAVANKRESDRKKIEYIYAEYRQLMYNKAFNILNDRGLAEDALCDAFDLIWKLIAEFDDPRSSRSIVLAVTIVRNCAYALSDGKAQDLEPAKESRDFSAKGLEKALYELSSSDIIKVVNKLGGENKNIFLMKYAFGFSNGKTAKTLKEPEGNVAARLQKAQRKLRVLLLKGWD